METSNNVAATETLKTLNSVRDVKAASEGLVVTINADGTHLLPQMMNMLKDKGIEISSVNLKKPTLDDVFVHYTGRDIRNAGAEKLRRIQPRSGR